MRERERERERETEREREREREFTCYGNMKLHHRSEIKSNDNSYRSGIK